MKNQLPKPPANPGGPAGAGTAAPGPRAWGYRSRYFPQGHATIEIPVYRMMIWGAFLYQRPASNYTLVLN